MLNEECGNVKEVLVGSLHYVLGYPFKLQVCKVVENSIWFHMPNEESVDTFLNLGYEAPGLVVVVPKDKITNGYVHTEHNTLNPYVKLLYSWGYNLIPVKANKKPDLQTWEEWKTNRVPQALMDVWCLPKTYRDDNDPKMQEYVYYSDFALIAGVSFGELPPIVCLDPDDQEAEAIVLAKCSKTAAMSINARGTHHRIYRRPTGGCPTHLKMWVDGQKYNLDLKADLSYFIIPGSHNKTATAPWTKEMILSLPVYDPAWLPPGERPRAESYQAQDRNYDDSEMGLRAQAYAKHLAGCPGATEGEGADNYAYCLAIAGVHEYGVNEEIVIESLFDWGQKSDNVDKSRDYYPWTLKQIQHKVASALKAEPKIPRLTLPQIIHKLNGNSYLQYSEIEDIIKPIDPDDFKDAVEPPTPPRNKFMRFFDKYQVPVKARYSDPNDRSKGVIFTVEECPCCGLDGDFILDNKGKKTYQCAGKNGTSWDDARRMWKSSGQNNWLSLDDVLAAPDPEWLIPDYLAKMLVTVIYGPPEVCKSFFELDRLLCVAYGVPYLGIIPTNVGKVAYFYAEGGSDGAGLKRRTAAWLKYHQISRDDPKKQNIFFSSYRYDLSLERQIDKLVDSVKTQFGTLDVVCLDTLAKHFNGKENEEMGKMVNSACDIQSALSCAVDIIHHTGKDITKGERGGSQLRAGVDNAIEVAACDMSDLQENMVESIKVTPRKRKDGRKTRPMILKLHEIELSEKMFDQSIVLIPSNAAVPTDKEMQSKHECNYNHAKFLEIVPTNWITFPAMVANMDKHGIKDAKNKITVLAADAEQQGKVEIMTDPSHKQRKLIRAKN